VPLGPDGVTFDDGLQELRTEVRDTAEYLLPVLSDLLVPAEVPAWMNRLLAAIVGSETRDEGVQVVTILRRTHVLQHRARI
jgi:hypothetical protein